MRERKDAIPLLAREFLGKYNKKHAKDVVIEEEAISLFKQYEWPGNIRELENLIERMVVTNNVGVITRDEVSSVLGLKNRKVDELGTKPLKDMVEELEKDVIISAIKKYGSVNKAASVLGLSQPALWKKCQKFNINTKDLLS